MIDIPPAVLKEAWVAGCKARRAAGSKHPSDYIDASHLWDAEPDAEAGMKAAAQVIVRWAKENRVIGMKEPS